MVVVVGGGWRLVVVGWWFVVGGWWWFVGGWWLAVVGWWLAVDGGWLVGRREEEEEVQHKDPTHVVNIKTY